MVNPSETVKPRSRKRVLESIVGQTFAFIHVVEERRTKNNPGRSLFEVLVRCECGVEKWVAERSVRRGLTTSCGSCASKTHGGSRTPEYAVWRSMHARCSNPKHPAYKNYGARGLTVCQEWGSFGMFLRDMGAQPFKGASIERLNNALGYSKSNCVWANAAQQCINRRTNHLVCAFGETRTISQWAEKTGLRHNTISYRLANGWSAEAALSTKPNFTNRKEK